MKAKKIIPLVILTLMVLVLTGIGIFSFYAREKDNNLKENKIQQEEKKETDSKETETTEQKNTNDEKNSNAKDESIGNENNNNINSETKSESKQDNTIKNNNSSNQSVSTTNQTQPQQAPQQSAPTPAPKSCTPKKFDMSFVRADFTSFSQCKEKGDLYKAEGWGYFCDNYVDDCGDTYYMLTLYERNTGIEHDYHDIQLSAN